MTTRFARLSPDLSALTPKRFTLEGPKPKTVLGVKVNGARGIPPEFTEGATVTIEVGGESFASPGAQLQASATCAGISSELQSLVTRLYEEERYEEARIAELARMPVGDVERILQAAKVNTCVWHHGIHTFVQRPLDAEVKLVITVPTVSLGMTVARESGSCTCALARVIDDGGCRQLHLPVSVGSYTVQLDAEVSLWSLEPASALPGSAASGSSLPCEALTFDSPSRKR